MSLIVKIMSGENLPDDDPQKSFILHAGVAYVEFQREPAPIVHLNFPDQSGFGVPCSGNVYVMNEQGKTIASYNGRPFWEPTKTMIRYNGGESLYDAPPGPYEVGDVYKLLNVPGNYTLVEVGPESTVIPRTATGKLFLRDGVEYASILDPDFRDPGLTPA